MIELPSIEIPGFTDDFLFTLQTRGFLPVLAHPERHPVLAKQPQILKEWLERGMLVQLNAGSLTGRMGAQVMKFAGRLVTNRMVHLIGSDGHGINNRRPIINAAVATITKLIGAEAAERICRMNPSKVLQDQDLELPETDAVEMFRANKKLFGFWRRSEI